MHADDFLWKRAIWTGFGGGGEDGREGEGRAERRVREDGGVEGAGRLVAHEVEEADLVVDNEEGGVGFVEAGVGGGGCWRGA